MVSAPTMKRPVCSGLVVLSALILLLLPLTRSPALLSSSIEHSFPDLVLQWFRMFVNYQKMRADSLTSLHCGFIGVFDKGDCF